MFPIDWRKPALASRVALAGLALAYFLTYQPAPIVHVTWAPSVTESQQARLERRYLLLNRRDPQERSYVYDLLDTSRRNVEALVQDPDVMDTHNIDRQRFEVPFEIGYGEEWMWVAHRTPGLRNREVRWSLIVALATIAVVGIRQSRRGTRTPSIG